MTVAAHYSHATTRQLRARVDELVKTETRTRRERLEYSLAIARLRREIAARYAGASKVSVRV